MTEDTQVKPQRVAPDWERIEFDYRAGVLTLREIADANKISHGAINKRAKRDGWLRDLSAKIKAKAEALVSKALVSSEVSKARLDTERQTIDANAQVIADIHMRQRGGLRNLMSERVAMLEELTKQRADLIPLERVTEILAELEDKPADATELRKVFARAVGLGGRVGILKALAEIDAKLVPLERQAWNMDDPASTDGGQSNLSDAERASRLATLLDRARAAADAADS